MHTNCLWTSSCKIYWLSGTFPISFFPVLKTASSLWHKPLLLSLHFSPLPSDLTYIQLLQWPLQSNQLLPWHCLTHNMGKRNQGSNRKALLVLSQVLTMLIWPASASTSSWKPIFSPQLDLKHGQAMFNEDIIQLKSATEYKRFSWLRTRSRFSKHIQLILSQSDFLSQTHLYSQISRSFCKSQIHRT